MEFQPRLAGSKARALCHTKDLRSYGEASTAEGCLVGQPFGAVLTMPLGTPVFHTGVPELELGGSRGWLPVTRVENLD